MSGRSVRRGGEGLRAHQRRPKGPAARRARELGTDNQDADTGDDGVARFIGVRPAQGRANRTITVTLRNGAQNLYCWFDWSSGRVKPGNNAADAVTRAVSSNREELFYFEAVEQASALVVEVNRYDGKKLKRRVTFSLTPDSRADTTQPPRTAHFEDQYRGGRLSPLERQRRWKGLKEGSRFHNDRQVLSLPAAGYDVKIRNKAALLAAHGAGWQISPASGKLHLDVPAAGEARAVFTLTRYTHVQCVPLVVGVGTVGRLKQSEDLRVRCDILKAAIAQAAPHVDPSPAVLKVFMAPEFYFQGRKGGYPLDFINGVKGKKNKPGILAMLRPTISRSAYKDWLFVLGTAIGKLEHDVDAYPYPLEIRAVDDGTKRVRVGRDPAEPASDPAVCGWIANVTGLRWKLVQGGREARVTAAVSETNGTYQLTLNKTPGFVAGPCELQQAVPGLLILRLAAVAPNLLTVTAGRDPASACAGVTAQWTARQAGVAAVDVVRAQASAAVPGGYDLHMAGAVGAFQVGQLVYLREPDERTEVFNIAFVHKGGPDPQNPGGVELPNNRGSMLRDLIVYKEYVSSIDYDEPVAAQPWARRRVRFGGQERTVLPTQGARDQGGGAANQPAAPGRSEVQGNSLGGGSVFTIDGVTFGMEICLDHLKAKLDAFYQPGGGVRSGDPMPQVQLIPSCGMSIGGGPVRCLPNGLVFNVDGGCYFYSVVRAYDGNYSCDEHRDVSVNAAGECPRPANQHERYFYCKMPHNQTALHFADKCWCPQGAHRPAALGTCACGTALVRRGATSFYECSAPHASNDGIHAPGAGCWCTVDHSGANPGKCACGGKLVKSSYFYCAHPHNLHASQIAGGACGTCGGALVAGTCHACNGVHNHTDVHHEGQGQCRTSAACAQAHTQGATGTCATCAGALTRIAGYRCASAHAKATVHFAGRCRCGVVHAAAAPGACATCHLDLGPANGGHYCDRDHNIRRRRAMAGRCGICRRDLLPRSYWACATHPGVQYRLTCSQCNARTTKQTFYYCAGSHNLRVRPVAAPGRCVTCHQAFVARTDLACPGRHDQQTAVESTAGTCATCRQALAPIRAYVCTELHDRIATEHVAGACATCGQARVAVAYHHCDRPHNLREVYDPRHAARSHGGLALAQARYCFCPQQHAQDDTAEAAGRCATCASMMTKPQLVQAWSTRLVKMGSLQNPSWPLTDVDISAIRDSRGQIRWRKYFKKKGQIAVYPIYPIPPARSAP